VALSATQRVIPNANRGVIVLDSGYRPRVSQHPTPLKPLSYGKYGDGNRTRTPGSGGGLERPGGANGESRMGQQGITDEEAAARYAQAVGFRLRAVRRQKRLSLQAVEKASGEEFKASVLGAYERGERTISVPRLQRLAQIYDVPVDQLLPSDTSNPLNRASQLGARAGNGDRHGRKVTIDLVRLNQARGPERDLLRHFLASVQVQRQDFNGKVLTIREEDLRVMASMFGRNVEALVGRLEELGLLLPVAGQGTATAS
jgi:transcriptional regulator with XRE-family HTH domain